MIFTPFTPECFVGVKMKPRRRNGYKSILHLLHLLHHFQISLRARNSVFPIIWKHHIFSYIGLYFSV